MSPEAQRTAMAKLEGWRNTQTTKLGVWIGLPPSTRKPHNVLVPDYLNDLNATHAVEEKFTRGQWGKWTKVVAGMLGMENPRTIAWHINFVIKLQRLTAAQRTEAILRTLNIWDDTK